MFADESSTTYYRVGSASLPAHELVPARDVGSAGWMIHEALPRRQWQEVSESHGPPAAGPDHRPTRSESPCRADGAAVMIAAACARAAIMMSELLADSSRRYWRIQVKLLAHSSRSYWRIQVATAFAKLRPAGCPSWSESAAARLPSP